MKKVLFSLVAGLSLLNVSLTYADSGIPKIAVAEDTFNFGTVSEGQIITHEFTIANKGSAPLLVQRGVPSCGCTIVDASTAPIAPEATSIIKVTFDTSGFQGSKIKTVKLFTNDPENPDRTLTLKGTIESLISLDPPRVNFGDVVRGSPVHEQSVTISVPLDREVQLGEISSKSPEISITRQVKNAHSVVATLTLRDELIQGNFSGQVLIPYTYNNQNLVLPLPVTAQIKSPVELQPSRAAFGVLPEGGEQVSRIIRVLNKSKEKLSILNVEKSSELLKVEITPLKTGYSAQVNISIDPGAVDRDIQEKVILSTNLPTDAKIVIPVYAYKRR